MRPLAAVIAAALAVTPAGAQTPPRADTVSLATSTAGPPIRRIESAVSVSKELIGAVTNIRALSDGRVLVNDGTRRRLIMLDSSLALVKVVLDSITTVEDAYGGGIGYMLPHRGDSTLFMDRGSYAMLILDGNGKVARVTAVPSTQYLTYLSGTASVTSYGTPGVDPAGRLVFRIPVMQAGSMGMTTMVLSSGEVIMSSMGAPGVPPPDSSFIVRMNVATRKLDTIGAIKIPKVMSMMTTDAEGYSYARPMTNPMPVTDDWALMPDGTIALVRGRDYRIEWIAPDGKRSSSPKLPYPWQRLTDDLKIFVIDSVRKQMQQDRANNYYFSVMNWANRYGQPYPDDFSFPENLNVPPGMPSNFLLPKGFKLPADYAPGPPATGVLGATNGVPMPNVPPPPAATTPAAGASTAAGGRGAPPPAATAAAPGRAGGAGTSPGALVVPPMPTPATTGTSTPILIMPPEELPDYRAPFSGGAVRADADGNLWVRTVQPKPVPGGIVYDVVSRAGEIIDRFLIPTGHTLVGFGPGGVIYLTMRDATGLHLERVKLRK
jgi:hypothetical protein